MTTTSKGESKDKADHCDASSSGNTDDDRTFDYVGDVLPRSFVCCVCSCLLNQPVQIPCGERCCLKCFKRLLRNPGPPFCPSCGKQLESKQCWRDVFAEKEIENLEVRCPNLKRGCTWTGMKVSVGSHQQICSYERISCPNRGCEQKIYRLDETHHRKNCKYRQAFCIYCKKDVPHLEYDSHLLECLEAVIDCPNGCSLQKELLRKDLHSHLEKCDLAKANDGQSVTPQLIAASKGAQTVNQELGLLRNTISETRRDFRTLQQSNTHKIEALTERITNLETQATDMQAHQKLVQTKILEACYQSVENAQRDYGAKFDHLESHLRMMTEKMLKMEEIMTSQAARIQSLENEASSLKNSTGNTLSSTSGIGMSSGLTPLVEQQFSQQDRILATHDIQLAEHGLRIDMLDCKNVEGVLLWKITDVRRRRRDAVSGQTPSIYSQPFYTSGGGYKLCARLYLNGDGMGKGTHLSLFFVVMRGEYDALLPWPFQQKVTLVLMDQTYGRHVSDTFRPDPTSSSFRKPRNEMNIASGCPLFVSLATLDSGCYIQDDTMFVKVVVDTSDVARPDKR